MVSSTQLLLIEDNPGDASLLQATLKMIGPPGFSTRHGATLGEGLKILGEGGIELILLDLQLPDSVGLETVRRVQEVAKDLPIVILSGSDDDAMALEAINSGIQDYLVKGTDGRTIARAIRYAMERKRLEVELRKANDTLEQRVKARTADLDKTVTMLGQEILEHERVERELLEFRQRFHDMTNGMPIVLWMSTPDMRQMLYCNNSFERLFGHSCEELYRNPALWLESIHPSDQPQVKEAIHAWGQQGGWRTSARQESIFRVVRPDGSEVRVKSRAFAITEGPNLRYVCGLTEPVGELVEEEVLASPPEATIKLDEQGRITIWCKLTERVLGLKAQNVIGKNLLDVLSTVGAPLPEKGSWFASLRRSKTK